MPYTPMPRGVVLAAVAAIATFPMLALLLGEGDVAARAFANSVLSLVALLFMAYVLVPLVYGFLGGLGRDDAAPTIGSDPGSSPGDAP